MSNCIFLFEFRNQAICINDIISNFVVLIVLVLDQPKSKILLASAGIGW